MARVFNYRVELRLAVYEDEVRKQSENDAVMRADPTNWDTHALFRAICFGLVNKFESKVLAVERMEENKAAERSGGEQR